MSRTPIKAAATRTEARGLDALADEPQAARPAKPQRRAATPDPAGGADTWTATHRRLTFFCPNDLWNAIQAERDRTGRSKSEIIQSGIRGELRKQVQ